MKTFAGFWRDGAVVQPSEKHWSDCKCIFAIQKHDNSLDICLRKYDEWDRVYWLDTTTPTELTPQEAYELLKVISPTTKYIRPWIDSDFIKAEPFKPIINWGEIKEYPPKKKWSVPTDADKGKKCRFKDTDREWNQNDDGYLGTFLCTTKDKFIIETTCGVSRWFYCEVLDE